MEAIALVREERKREGKESEFTWHGQPVEKGRLERFVRREGLCLSACVSQGKGESLVDGLQ
jgi:hypothetical protein